jgi:hypothetical protein
VTKRGAGAAIPNERGAYACSKDYVCRRERSVRKRERGCVRVRVCVRERERCVCNVGIDKVTRLRIWESDSVCAMKGHTDNVCLHVRELDRPR